ncbi:hypothetical protein ABLN64_00460 [Mycobacterium tuberculosis]
MKRFSRFSCAASLIEHPVFGVMTLTSRPPIRRTAAPNSTRRRDCK